MRLVYRTVSINFTLKCIGDFQDVLSSSSNKDYDVSDSILEAYRKAFQANMTNQNVKIRSGSLHNNDRSCKDSDWLSHAWESVKQRPRR